MKMRGRFGGEEGTAAIELALVLPLAVIVILFLLGLGYTIMVKQQALVAARFSAFYHVSKESEPSIGEVSGAVVRLIRAPRERWEVTRGSENAARDAGIDSGLLDSLWEAVDSTLNGFGRDGIITYTASREPRRGALPRIYNFGQVGAHYSLANGTWTCDRGGNYFSLIVGQLGVPSEINLPTTLSCCETYRPGGSSQ